MNEQEHDPTAEYANWQAEPDNESETPIELPEEAFQRYKNHLALDEQQLAGKTILDAGSNESQFGKYLEEKYPGTKVVSMDLNRSGGVSVQGSVDQLPFRNESFDMIVSHAVPLDPPELRRTVLEMIAALKIRGEIRIGPFFKGETGDFSNQLWSAIHSVAENEQGKNIVIEDIPVGEWQFPDGPQTRYCVVIKKLN